jgi:hypothetical protein
MGRESLWVMETESFADIISFCAEILSKPSPKQVGVCVRKPDIVKCIL